MMMINMFTIQEMTMKKCKCSQCETFVNCDNVYYDKSGDIWCEDCYESITEYLSTAIGIFPDGHKETYKFDEHFCFDEYLGECEYPPCIKGQHYVRTDGWRGYQAVDFHDGWTQVSSGWVTGYPDDSTKRKADIAELYEQLYDGELTPPVEVWWVFAITSNVFSTACDIVCRSAELPILEAWLETIGQSKEDLEYMLG